MYSQGTQEAQKTEEGQSQPSRSQQVDLTVSPNPETNPFASQEAQSKATSTELTSRHVQDQARKQAPFRQAEREPALPRLRSKSHIWTPPNCN